MQKVHQLEMLTVEQSSTGAPHSPMWMVTFSSEFAATFIIPQPDLPLSVNGQVMGSATAPQKWKAKDTAAKKTLVALGVLTG